MILSVLFFAALSLMIFFSRDREKKISESEKTRLSTILDSEVPFSVIMKSFPASGINKELQSALAAAFIEASEKFLPSFSGIPECGDMKTADTMLMAYNKFSGYPVFMEKVKPAVNYWRKYASVFTGGAPVACRENDGGIISTGVLSKLSEKLCSDSTADPPGIKVFRGAGEEGRTLLLCGIRSDTADIVYYIEEKPLFYERDILLDDTLLCSEKYAAARVTIPGKDFGRAFTLIKRRALLILTVFSPPGKDKKTLGLFKGAASDLKVTGNKIAMKGEDEKSVYVLPADTSKISKILISKKELRIRYREKGLIFNTAFVYDKEEVSPSIMPVDVQNDNRPLASGFRLDRGDYSEIYITTWGRIDVLRIPQVRAECESCYLRLYKKDGKTGRFSRAVIINGKYLRLGASVLFRAGHIEHIKHLRVF